MDRKFDTDEMTYDEVNELVQELRKVRTRKEILRDCIEGFRANVDGMRNRGMALVNKYTGEVLVHSDWELYDETTQTIYPEKKGEAE